MGFRLSMDLAKALMNDIKRFKKENGCSRVVMIWCGSTETYMKEGDKAKLILPSHLAYGLIGDQNKIPQKATIIYDIELLELIEKEG